MPPLPAVRSRPIVTGPASTSSPMKTIADPAGTYARTDISAAAVCVSRSAVLEKHVSMDGVAIPPLTLLTAVKRGNAAKVGGRRAATGPVQTFLRMK